jgi:hypothetical protein
MAWTTPSFEEINMDAEARGYGLWISDLEVQPAEQAEATQDEARATDE